MSETKELINLVEAITKETTSREDGKWLANNLFVIALFMPVFTAMLAFCVNFWKWLGG